MAFPPTDWLDWTTAEYDVGAPATSLSFERWFRNPVALAQGAVGAPRIEFEAMSGWYTTPGGVGTYVFAMYAPGTNTNVGRGGVVSGSLLASVSAAAGFWTGSTGVFDAESGLSGSWQCMGTFDYGITGSTTDFRGATLWQRIA